MTTANRQHEPTNLKYQLSTTLEGHAQDVRCVCFHEDGTDVNKALTGSRDKSVKVWMRSSEEASVKYTPMYTYDFHQHFIACLASVSPSETYSQGVFAVGSNDKTASVVKFGENTPLHVLKGHSESVSAIDALMVKDDHILTATGSWDNDIKIWLDGVCKFTLKGHVAAVWAVKIIKNGDKLCIVSGSADKSVKLWNALNGKLVYSLDQAHNDAVRAISVYKNGFVTCSNDASIKVWRFLLADNAPPTCANTLYGHTNFIYSLFAWENNKDEFYIASCGEDHSLRVWNLNTGVVIQNISLPSESLWSLAGNQRSPFDLLIGGSDHKARVFTADSSRYAPKAEADVLNKLVEEMAMKSQATIGGVKKEDLPGVEALQRPGIRDGQQRMIVNQNKSGTVELHSWNKANQTWSYIGEVVGGENDGPKHEKTMHNGKEYDFVFDIDISENQPHIKLAYNLDEDVWTVAKTFIETHTLPLVYLEQVANFITKNTKEARFAMGETTNPNPTSNTDPATAKKTKASTENFTSPQDYLLFDKFNMDGMLSKIKQLSVKLKQSDNNSVLSDDQIEVLLKLKTPNNIQNMADFNTQLTETFKILVSWDQEYLFPIIDLLRAMVNVSIFTNFILDAVVTTDGGTVFDFIYKQLEPGNDPRNVFLGIRFIANCFKFESIRNRITSKTVIENTLNTLSKFASSKNKLILTSLVTVLLNYSVSFHEGVGFEAKEENELQILYILMEILGDTSDIDIKTDEIVYRSLMSILSLILGEGQTNKGIIGTIRSLNFTSLIAPIMTDSRYTQRNTALSSEIYSIISS